MLDDLRGKIFGCQMVLDEPHVRINRRTLWKCKCLGCGSIGLKSSGNLKSHSNPKCKNCPSKFEDIRNMTFGSWLVLDLPPNIRRIKGKTYYHWKVRCGCGLEKYVRTSVLKNQESTKCVNCNNRLKCFYPLKEDANVKHPLYNLWKGVKSRVYNKNSQDYINYGGRGVNMYDDWVNDFKAFSKYMEENLGDKPSKVHSLDRVNNELGYIPGNLRWATPTEQKNNQRPRKDSIWIMKDGEMVLLVDVSEKLNINHKKIKGIVCRNKIKCYDKLVEILKKRYSYG